MNTANLLPATAVALMLLVCVTACTGHSVSQCGPAAAAVEVPPDREIPPDLQIPSDVEVSPGFFVQLAADDGGQI